MSSGNDGLHLDGVEVNLAAPGQERHLHQLVAVVVLCVLPDVARGVVEREMMALDVDQLEVLLHEGGAQEDR